MNERDNVGELTYPSAPLATPLVAWLRTFGLAVAAAVFGWAYWPTLCELLQRWETEPDYSHGYLVAPIAIVFLWARRETFPGIARGLGWAGLLLLGLSLAMRFVGARYFLGGVDGWSILVWAAGAVWFLCGSAVFWWSLPSVAFLWFMIPLPFGLERGLSLPLQRLATQLSCWTLQLLGQPAVAEGSTLWLGDFHLEVERACSGLRIFVGIVALAFAYVVLVRRSWWERLFLLASAIPVAVVANVARIVLTAFFYQHWSDEAARRFAHDFAGWVTIPLAAALFGAILLYLRLSVVEFEETDAGALLQQQRREL